MKVGFQEHKELYGFVAKRWLYWLSQFFINDRALIKLKHKVRLGERLELDRPQTFNEKIQWLKLNWRDETATICADKYAVRGFVVEKVGRHILNRLIAVYDRVDEIDLSRLPDAFVLKVTHGCGQNILCRSQEDIDWSFAMRSLRFYMKINHYYHGKEWAYKHIVPRIICEDYLEEDGQPPLDYKFLCFDGTPQMVQVDTDRFTNHTRTMYDMNWRLLDVAYTYPMGPAVQKPRGFDEMAHYAGLLSAGFPFVRVDFYNIGERVIFGEMTYYPESGSNQFNPKSFDAYLGSFLRLPQ